MAEQGKYEPALEVQVKIGEGKFEKIASGKLSIPVNEEGQLEGLNDALADAFRWIAKQVEKDGKGKNA